RSVRLAAPPLSLPLLPYTTLFRSPPRAAENLARKRQTRSCSTADRELAEHVFEIAVHHRLATIGCCDTQRLNRQLAQVARQDGHHAVGGVHPRLVADELLELRDHDEHVVATVGAGRRYRDGSNDTTPGLSVFGRFRFTLSSGVCLSLGARWRLGEFGPSVAMTHHR